MDDCGGFLFATVAVASLVVRELRGPARVLAETPAARPLAASMPAAVPPRAVSVPVLPFLDGKEIRVGQTAAFVATNLGRAAESGRQEVDRGTLGERLTRFYDTPGPDSSWSSSPSSGTANRGSRRSICRESLAAGPLARSGGRRTSGSPPPSAPPSPVGLDRADRPFQGQRPFDHPVVHHDDHLFELTRPHRESKPSPGWGSPLRRCSNRIRASPGVSVEVKPISAPPNP